MINRLDPRRLGELNLQKPTKKSSNNKQHSTSKHQRNHSLKEVSEDDPNNFMLVDNHNMIESTQNMDTPLSQQALSSNDVNIFSSHSILQLCSIQQQQPQNTTKTNNSFSILIFFDLLIIFVFVFLLF